ncbi:MAG TPA: hypothetical protein VH951_05070 [Dehalococcoidia bacterium]|jgi:hypothetical protein
MNADKGRIDNDVLAVVRSVNDAREAATDLERNGFEADGIRVIHSYEAAEQIDAQGKNAGGIARIFKHVQSALSDQNELLEEYEEAANEGAEIVAVRVTRDTDIERARDILLAHNGENIRHFGSLAVKDLQDQGRAST